MRCHVEAGTLSLRPALNTNKHMVSSTSILLFGVSVFGFVKAGSQEGLEFTTFPRLALWAILLPQILKFPRRVSPQPADFYLITGSPSHTHTHTEALPPPIMYHSHGASPEPEMLPFNLGHPTSINEVNWAR